MQLKSKNHFGQTSFAYAINLNINVLVRHFVNFLGRSVGLSVSTCTFLVGVSIVVILKTSQIRTIHGFFKANIEGS